MSCHHEHSHHHGHDDDHLGPPNTNAAHTLYPYIDLANVRALNITQQEDAPKIIRSYESRLEDTPILTSDVDEELLIIIPFTGLVKLHSVLIRSLGDDTTPETIHLFKDKPQLDFDSASNTPPVQTLVMPQGITRGISTAEGSDDIVQFAVSRPKFSNIQSLTLHIPTNYGGEQTKLVYLGLRGEFSELKKAPVVAEYEVAANPADHRTETKNLEKSGPRLE